MLRLHVYMFHLAFRGHSASHWQHHDASAFFLNSSTQQQNEPARSRAGDLDMNEDICPAKVNESPTLRT